MNEQDRHALEDLMARYVDGANRRDAAQWSATWAETGCWRLMGMEVSGRAAILAMWEQALQAFEFALLLPSSSHFEVDGDRARGHWYLQEFTRTHDGTASAMVSRYQDEYVRENGSWLYLSRDYQVIYSGPPDLSGQYTPATQHPE